MNHEFDRKLTSGSPIAFLHLKIICSQDGNPSDCVFVDMNQAFERLTRQKSSELIGKRWSEIPEIGQEDTANMTKLLGMIARNRGKSNVEYYSTTLKRHFKLFAHAPEENSIALFLADITERVNELDSLRKNEQTFQLIKNSVRDCIWVFHVPTMRFTYASPSVQELLGYTPEEALHLSIEKIFTLDSIQIMQQAFQDAVAELSVDPKKIIHDVRVVQHLRKDGTSIWVDMNATYRFNDKQEIEVIGISRNVDERIKREAEISYLNNHEPLTGLLNRSALRLLKKDLARREPLSGERSVIAIDIDNFRMVNIRSLTLFTTKNPLSVANKRFSFIQLYL